MAQIPELTLEHVNMPGRSPEVLVRHAAAAGFESISLRVQPFSRSEEVWLPADAGEMRVLTGLLDETGVTVAAIDVFPLRPRLDVESFRNAYRFAAEVGARHALTTCATPERDLLLEQAVQAADLAVEYGVTVNLEFSRLGSLHTLRDAVALVREAGRPNLGIAFDMLHWARSGGTFEDIRDAGSAITHVQICDAPAENQWPTLVDEAIRGRLLPGEGALPVVDLLRALPRDALYGLEICVDEAVQTIDQTWIDRMAAAARGAFADAQPVSGSI
jgi:sugar phosphate isomerase/epimerase